MKRRDLAFVFTGLAVAGTAGAATDTQQIDFNINGASSITVSTNVSMTMDLFAGAGGSQTSGLMTYNVSGEAGSQLTYTSVTGNTEAITVLPTLGAVPAGTTLDVTATVDGLVGTGTCGVGSGASFPTGGPVVSGINNGVGCAADLVYDWNVSTT